MGSERTEVDTSGLWRSGEALAEEERSGDCKGKPTMGTDTHGRTILVLGMHRSGTSALTGSLEEAGVFLGPVVRASPDNPKGWCENPVIFMMHEDILRMNGGSWFSPPEACRWHRNHELMRDTIIEAFKGHRVWGFKDPRCLFTLDGWLKGLPSVEPVGIFRHPRLVTASLRCRNNYPEAEAMQLWLKYNLKLLQWHERLGFPILSFDDFEFTFGQQVRALVTDLRLPRQSQMLGFYEARFRHTHAEESEPLPRDIRGAYDALKEICHQWYGNRVPVE